jgi:hypothetical protein
MIRDWTDNRVVLDTIINSGEDYFSPKLKEHNIGSIEFIIDRFKICIYVPKENDYKYDYTMFEDPMMNPWTFKQTFKTEQDIVNKIKEEFNYALEEQILINV